LSVGSLVDDEAVASFAPSHDAVNYLLSSSPLTLCWQIPADTLLFD